MTESQGLSGRTEYDKLIPEQELLDRLGIKKATLDHLRTAEGLPYFRVTKYARIYYEDDVVAWLKGRKYPVTIATNVLE